MLKCIFKVLNMYKELLIGCGSQHKKRLWSDDKKEWQNLITLDINKDHKPKVVHDLTLFPYPFRANTFDEIHAYEVLEHTGQQGDYKFFFRQFNELHRIMKPDSNLFATCPSIDSRWAWGDPSHTRVFPSEYLTFLSLENYRQQVGKTAISDFRYLMTCDFETVYCKDNGQHLLFALRAIK